MAVSDARSEVLVNRALMFAALAVVCRELGRPIACAVCVVLGLSALLRSLA
jgi:hypothetical protein